MIAYNRIGGIIVKIFLFTLISIYFNFVAPKALALTYEFDEGIEVLTEGLISKRGNVLRDKRIAVRGYPLVSRNAIMAVCKKKFGIRYPESIIRAR